jgi:hypothetical protein
MSLLSWQDISDNSAQKTAFQKIIEFCCTYDFTISDYYDLTHILMATAIKSMDYSDPSDGLSDLGHNPLRTRKVRLLHFMDDTLEFCKKRTALALEDDRYIDPLIEMYVRVKQDDKRLRALHHMPYLEKPHLDGLMDAYENFMQDLIAQGLPRLSVARAFLDMSFVVARHCPRDEYRHYCEYMCDALDPDQAGVEIGMGGVHELLSEEEEELLGELQLLAMPLPSPSIH